MFKKIAFTVCALIFTITFVCQESNVNEGIIDINNDISSSTSSCSEPSEDINSDPIETSSMSTATSSQIEKSVYYTITSSERKLIEEVVMAESGTESYQGQCAIAQCILDACKLENKRPAAIIKEYQFN